MKYSVAGTATLFDIDKQKLKSSWPTTARTFQMVLLVNNYAMKTSVLQTKAYVTTSMVVRYRDGTIFVLPDCFGRSL